MLARGADKYDALIISEELRVMGKLAEVGGVEYLYRLISSTPSTVNAEIYARLVESAYVRRRLLEVSDVIHTLALDEDKPTENVLQLAEDAFTKVRLFDDAGERGADEAGADYLDSMASIVTGQATPGVPTGFHGLDAIIGGLKPGQNIVVGAATGSGKTALMLSIALNAACAGKRVFIWSGEMTIDENVSRFVSMLSGVDLQKVVNKALTPVEVARVSEAVTRFRQLPIIINDSAMTPMQLGLRVKHHAMRGLDLVIVDYLGLLSVPGAATRYAELSAASLACKRIAKQERVAVLAASQLNRDAVRRDNARPGLHDFKESGEIENNADIILGLYRDDLNNENSALPNTGEVTILKHRHGPRGKCYLHFDAARAHFKGDAVVREISLNIPNRAREWGGNDDAA